MKQKTLSQFKQDLQFQIRDQKQIQEQLKIIAPLLNEDQLKELKESLLNDRFNLDLVSHSIDSIAESFTKFAIIKEAYDEFFEDVLAQIEETIPDPLASVNEITISVAENEVLLKNSYGKVKLSINGKMMAVPGKVVDAEAMAQTIINFLEDFDENDSIEEAAPSDKGVLEVDAEKDKDSSVSPEGEEPPPDVTDEINADEEGEDETAQEVSLDKEIETTQDDIKKQKLQILKNILDVKLIRKYAADQTERNRIVQALKNYILKGEDESYIKSEVQQQALIDFFLDLVDILLTNKRIANLVAVNASVKESTIESMEEFEQILTEAKKAPKFTGKRANPKKKKAPVDRVTPKLEMLLRLGLVDKPLFQRARKALTAKKEYGTIPFYRNLMLDMLDDLIDYIQTDPTLYNRMRINVMKEMKKSYLPSKKTVVDAYNAGMNHTGTEDEIPEEYNHYFAKEAFIRGMNEGCRGKKNKVMKEAKQSPKDIVIKPTKKEYVDAGYELIYRYIDGDDRFWYDPYLYQNGEEIIEIVDDYLLDNNGKNPDSYFRYELMDKEGQTKIAALFDKYLDTYYSVKTEAWSIRNFLKAGVKAGAKAVGSTMSAVGKGVKDPLMNGLGKGLSKLGEEDVMTESITKYKYKNRNGQDRVGVHFNESDLEKNLGFCIACGTKHDHIEPDARKYSCKKCKENLVYGLEELMMMGIAKPKMGRE